EDNLGNYPLQLRAQLPVIAKRSRNQEARLLFTGQKALPGSSGRIIWSSAIPHLPADIPVRRGDQIGVFMPNGGKAEFLPINNALEGQPSAVELPTEIDIIIEGRQGLDHGAPIEVSN
ncbi:MAG: efflux RND transporter periplasmic adaptor subunit, partial [Chromatiales bacterium]|nr:efflux RND transporter periplasmic adaptor subunit [Chromatiales bacterium]